jgi:hypothetical protein
MTRRIERALWMATVLFAAVAVAGWREGESLADESGSSARRPVTVALRQSESSGRATLGTLAASIAARDPFRLDRRPSAVAFGADPVAPVAPVDPSRRPRLLLTGTFGPPWQAVLEGIPGREGSVVARVGDVFGELRVRSIRRDTVVVQGADTTWKLTVRHVW